MITRIRSSPSKSSCKPPSCKRASSTSQCAWSAASSATPVRDAAAKGKIERFFRRVRDQFLVRKLDLSSLEELNKQFTHWVEHEYNATEHSTLGMKPIDRFGIDLSRIRFLSPSEDADELFYAETERTVKKDNTFSFQNVRYETPVDLRGRKVELRFERHGNGPVVVYENGQRMGLVGRMR